LEVARELSFKGTGKEDVEVRMGIRIEWKEQWTCAKYFTREEALAFVNANSTPALADDSPEEIIKEALEGMSLEDDLAQVEWEERDEAEVERQITAIV
jgi:hypothetical protein